MFDEDEPTVTDQALHRLRQATTATAIVAGAVKRQAARERDSLLGAFGIPTPPPALKTVAEWGGIILTLGSLWYLTRKASKARRRRR